MARFPDLRWMAALVASGVLAGALAAQEAQPRATAEPAPPASRSAVPPPTNPIINGAGAATPASALPNPKPRRPRVISPDVAAQLSAAAPKFVPPAPQPPPRVDEEEPDLREIDKPRNGIIRLPRYIVRERPPPVLNERAVNTRKGLEAIAMSRYLTQADLALNLHALPLFGTSASARAMARYEEDERLHNLAELRGDADMVSATDKAAGAYVKREVEKTFVRPGNFDWRPLGR